LTFGPSSLDMACNSTHTTLKDAMSNIVGSRLSSVTFVEDYVQFILENATVTAYTPLGVSTLGQTLTWSEAGYRDASGSGLSGS
jgi:hypothetical protein